MSKRLALGLVLCLVAGCVSLPSRISPTPTATPPPTATPAPTPTEDVQAMFRAAEEDVRRCYEKSKRDIQLTTELLRCPADYPERADCAGEAREPVCAYFQVPKWCLARVFGRTATGGTWDGERSKKWEDIGALQYDNVCLVCRLLGQTGEVSQLEFYEQAESLYSPPSRPYGHPKFLGYVQGPCPPEVLSK